MPDTAALLRRHLPVVVYDGFEPYTATGVEAMLGLGAAEAVRSRVELVRAGEGAPHATGGGEPAPLALLTAAPAGTYPDGVAWSRDDVLRMAGRDGSPVDRRRDGALQQEASGHVLHGHAVDTPGGLWLQYWFFHVGNDRVDPDSGPLHHEGDWEMVQVRLPRDGGTGACADTPDLVTFSQHRTAARRTWRAVRHEGDRLVVHPGRGTHALYPRRSWRGTWAVDIRDGAHRVADIALRVLADDDPVAAWPGRWGGQDGSPEGLAHRRVWTDPEGYHRDAEHPAVSALRAVWEWLASAARGGARRGANAARKPAVMARAATRRPDDPVPGAGDAARGPVADTLSRLPWPSGDASRRRRVALDRDPADPARLVLSVVIRDFGWSLSVAYLVVRLTSPGLPPRVYTWTVAGGSPGDGFRHRSAFPWSLDPARPYDVEVRAMPATRVGQLRVGRAGIAPVTGTR